MLDLKNYQISALEDFERWMDALASARERAQTAISALKSVEADVPVEVYNYPKTAWEALKNAGGIAASAGEYVGRTDGAGRPIPHVCLKVPTGGGKTLLAATALERLNISTGLILWITPTRAIYEQTKAALRNREHPYRQVLERASAGRFRFLEKDDRFVSADVTSYFCVMLLMLPAANRQQNKEFLRMFRDSGHYSSFFPDADDASRTSSLLERYSDLERTAHTSQIKHSLFNVFKLLRPVVILDEAHKAYGSRNTESNREFARSISRLNPSLVIELSATPNKGISNLLVDISGVELKKEEMIKLPIHVKSSQNAEWRNTLAEAHDELERLDAETKSLYMANGRYIRPIAVVRVERTGNDQRDGVRVHAEDVRDYLVQTLGVPQEAVAVKSAETDEIRGVDLLSPFNPIRWIVTKAALMEGWDCPFAYILVMLDNTSAQRALTQLVGRVIRQPHAQRTGKQMLDQCYVYCFNTDVALAVEQVKNGLEQEGLTKVTDTVVGGSITSQRVRLELREALRNLVIYLPLVLHRDEDNWTDLSYERHILPGINWSEIHAADQTNGLSNRARWELATVDVEDDYTVFHSSTDYSIEKTLNISWFTERITDLIPNPWQASRIVVHMLQNLKSSGKTDNEIHDIRSHLAFVLRDHLSKSIESQAESVYKRKLTNGDIRFDLLDDHPNFRMVESYEIPLIGEANGLLAGADHQPMKMSLFEPVYERHFDSSIEKSFARYLDRQKVLKWWHRIAVRQQGDYYLRGWRQDRIWPDFVAMADAPNEKFHLLIIETKGEQFRDNPDTRYKARLLSTLQEYFNRDEVSKKRSRFVGTFKLVFDESDYPIFHEQEDV